MDRPSRRIRPARGRERGVHLWAPARILSPDYFALPARRLKGAAVAIIVLIGVTGFWSDSSNYEFTTCHEYVLAGDDEPSNCRNVPPPIRSPDAFTDSVMPSCFRFGGKAIISEISLMFYVVSTTVEASSARIRCRPFCDGASNEDPGAHNDDPPEINRCCDCRRRVRRGRVREALAGQPGVRAMIFDKNGFHQFQPLLYQVATAELTPNDVAFDLDHIFVEHDNVEAYTLEVTATDPHNHSITLADGNTVKGDVLVLAAGAQPNFFRTPGAAEFAFPLYSVADAKNVRSRILELFEDVAHQPDLVAAGALNFVVVGAGPTGVEVAGALSELVARRDAAPLPGHGHRRRADHRGRSR